MIHEINGRVTDAHSLFIFHEEDTKHYPINGLTSNFQESRYTSDYLFSKVLLFKSLLFIMLVCNLNGISKKEKN